MKPIEFKSQARPYFSHLDPNGHVNTEHYLSYFLQHRFDAMREQLGLDLAELAELPITFFVRKVCVEYQRPLRGDHQFNVASRVTDWGNTSCIVTCEMEAADVVFATCTFSFICIDKKSSTPVPWPDDVKKMCFSEE